MYTLAELAKRLDGCLDGNPEQPIHNIASLSCATKTDLSYYDNPSLRESLAKTQAGAVLLTEANIQYCPANLIVVANPLDSMKLAAELFMQMSARETGIHPAASISPSARIGSQVAIGANTIVADGVFLGDGVRIAANCVIEADVCIGQETLVHSGVYIHSGSKLGECVVIESGVVLGAAPFNSVKRQGRWYSGPAVGGVIISDEVHLGANTVISRGALGDTYMGKGVHIDNLVQIAHDVTVGANTAIAGCAAIGAYAQIGAHCIIGGAACVAAEVHLADDVVITGMSTVNKSLSKAGVYSSGTMVSEHQRWRRNVARFCRLDDYMMRLTRLEKECSKAHE